jgi:hypothetical protein
VPRHRPLLRLTVWTFAGALLLKSAVPMFASLAAHLQGKGVAEVCTIYGVALPRMAAVSAHEAVAPGQAEAHGHDGHAMHGDHGAAGAHAEHAIHAAHVLTAGHDIASHHGGDSPPTHDAGGHGAGHCVLTALATFAADTAAATPLPMAASLALRLAASRQPLPAADAAARWAALLGHGPPRFS